MADTIGVAVPADVRRVVDAVRPVLDGVALRAHFHDTRHTGVANAVAAVERRRRRPRRVAGRDRRLPVRARRHRQRRHRGRGATRCSAAASTPASTSTRSSASCPGSRSCSAAGCRARCRRPARSRLTLRHVVVAQLDQVPVGVEEVDSLPGPRAPGSSTGPCRRRRRGTSRRRDRRARTRSSAASKSFRSNSNAWRCPRRRGASWRVHPSSTRTTERRLLALVGEAHDPRGEVDGLGGVIDRQDQVVEVRTHAPRSCRRRAAALRPRGRATPHDGQDAAWPTTPATRGRGGGGDHHGQHCWPRTVGPRRQRCIVQPSPGSSPRDARTGAYRPRWLIAGMHLPARPPATTSGRSRQAPPRRPVRCGRLLPVDRPVPRLGRAGCGSRSEPALAGQPLEGGAAAAADDPAAVGEVDGEAPLVHRLAGAGRGRAARRRRRVGGDRGSAPPAGATASPTSGSRRRRG